MEPQLSLFMHKRRKTVSVRFHMLKYKLDSMLALCWDSVDWFCNFISVSTYRYHELVKHRKSHMKRENIYVIQTMEGLLTTNQNEIVK